MEKNAVKILYYFLRWSGKVDRDFPCDIQDICTLSEYKEVRYHAEKEKCGQGMLSKDNQDMQLGAALVVQDPGSQGG